MKNDAFYYQTKKSNIILLSDAYKATHWLQYPKGTKTVYSYFESRGGEFDQTLFFGLQILLKKYLQGIVVERWMIEEADAFFKKVFAQDYFNRAGWEYILNVHGGKLPVRIKAVNEGEVIGNRNVLMTIENTDPEVAFITNYLETLLSEIWYPSTVATLSREIKKLIKTYTDAAGEEVSIFHLNDFGFRGSTSVESAGIGDCAHLISFSGTDTLEGIKYAMNFYDADVCGYSVMAAEHSTVTSYGKENEALAYEEFMNRFPDDALLSIVCDSYDTMNAVDNIFGKQLHDKIMARKGKIVVRPDSGYPPEVSLEILQSLWKNFGGTINKAGFKVLDPHVGVIYGDGINYAMIGRILYNVVTLGGFAPSNIVFGSGGGLIQQVNRDTMKFAFKCSAIDINGEWHDVYKDPITDVGKSSKRGKLALINKPAGKYNTIRQEDLVNYPDCKDELVTVFENGELLVDYTFDEVRKRASL